MSASLAPASAPPWRTLGMLAALVVLAHAAVLRQPPDSFGQPPASARPAPTFVTRSITLPPPLERSATPAPAIAAVKPTAPAAKPFLKKKVPIAHVPRALLAIESIANPVSLPPLAEAAPAAIDSTPIVTPSPPSTSPAPPADTPEPALALPVPSAAEAAAPASGPSQTPVTAMALPGSARLDYRLSGRAKGLIYHAKGELVWRNTGARYDARLTVSALFLGSRTMTSSGDVGAEGLAPSRFSDKSRSEVAAHFDAGKGQIVFSANTPVLPWVNGAQDRVSVVLQLGGMLAGNPAGFPAGSLITMYTVGPRDADSWTFRVEGDEALTLPFGELQAVKLSRQPRREYDQKVEVWYAPSLGYLPVRSKITQANGDYVDQELSSLERP